MNLARLTSGLLTMAALASVMGGVGCNQNDGAARPGKGVTQVKEKSTHEGWWCQEHGIPEDMCSVCMSEAAAKKKFKDQGDWCKEHNRAQSQCFKCDPAKYKKFEDMYVAKYGKTPVPPPKEEFEKL